MAALIRHIRFFRTAIVFSSRTVGYGRRLRGRLPPRKVVFPLSCRLPSARHPNGFSLFLYLSKVFYTRLEILLGCRIDRYLISAILGVNGRLLPFASYRSMVTSRSTVAVVLATRHPRIAELHFLLPLPV